MIGCSRTLIRVNRCWNSPHLFQGYDGLSWCMDPSSKKHKAVWRPISTQSTTSTSELGVQVQVVPQLQDSSKNGETTLPISKQGGADDKVEGEIHSISVQVSASLMRFLKGKRGSTHNQIEEETGAKVIFPSSKKDNSVVIEGASIESITKASEKIQVILKEAVESPNLDYSHFISLPLALHPGLVDKLINFHNSILGTTLTGNHAHVSSDQQIDGGNLKVEVEKERVKASKSSNLSDLGIEKSIFINPKTFHLTVLMLNLWNNERVTAATELLQRVSSKVMDALEGRPIFVRLKGLETMKGSLAKARVLYTPVEVIGGEDRLLHACQVITDAYVEAGLVLEKDAHRKLKLHGTVMNVRHRKRKTRTEIFDSFDARGIVERYGSEDWGEYIIPEVHLSQRFMFDENGYYHCCSSIPFPKTEQLK